MRWGGPAAGEGRRSISVVRRARLQRGHCTSEARALRHMRGLCALASLSNSPCLSDSDRNVLYLRFPGVNILSMCNTFVSLTAKPHLRFLQDSRLQVKRWVAGTCSCGAGTCRTAACRQKMGRRSLFLQRRNLQDSRLQAKHGL